MPVNNGNATQLTIYTQMLANLMADPRIAQAVMLQIAELPEGEQVRLLDRISRPQVRSLAEALTELPQSKPLEIINSDYILSTDWPEPVWVVPDMLPAGLSILAGAPKVGKSWLALQLCLAKAAGGSFFDKSIQQGPTLYLALEDPPRRLKSRMQRQGWPLGLPAHFITMGEFDEQIGDIRNGGGEKLARQIEREGYHLVVIDTLSRTIRGDQQDVGEMTEWLTPIQELAHRVNCAVVIIDHHRKPGSQNKSDGNTADPIADILGSTAKGAMVDTAWGLYKARGQVAGKLSITGREVIEITHDVEFDQEFKYWKPTGETGALKITARRREIMDYLDEAIRATCDQIAKAISQPKSNTHNRLQELVKAGELRRILVDSKPYYEINVDDNENE